MGRPASPGFPACPADGVAAQSLGHRFSGRPRVCGFVPIAGLDETREERVRAGRLRLEFRMELDGQVPGMAWKLGNFDELAVGRTARDLQAMFGERRLV